MANPLSAPPGTRFPEAGDDRRPFEPREPLRDKVDFAEILSYHAPEDRKFTLLGVHEA